MVAGYFDWLCFCAWVETVGGLADISVPRILLIGISGYMRGLIALILSLE